MANAQQRQCLVLYGSATGNAEEIARAISEEAPNYGIDARYACLDQFKKGELTPGSVCVFVVSTTGEGEAPENCSRFMRTIKRKSQKPTMFEGISFTCCGLGDTNYTHFCNTGKFVNRRMCELGAEKFYAECEADEGVGGLEQFIEPWKEGLWGPLRIALGMDIAKVAAAPAAEETEAPATATAAAGPSGTGEVSGGSGDGVAAAAASASRLSLKELEGMGSVLEAMGDPSAVARHAVASHTGAALFSAKPTAAHQLTSDDSAKTVWHMQLDVSAAGLAEPLQPGDAVGVLVPNAEADVLGLCARLGCDATSFVTVCANEGGLPSHLPKEPCTVGAILSRCCDLHSTSRKSLLKALATCCADKTQAEALARLASKEGKDDYGVQILQERPTVLELLMLYPSCSPPLELLLELLPPLAPRYYSLSSSPLGPNGPSSIGFAFTVVEYATPGGAKRAGLATTYLATLAVAVNAGSLGDVENLHCFPKPTPSFHLPEDPATPCVLIGPGTGVAPFVGFAQHRLAQADEAARGKLELYFGCREEKTDFLYRDVLEAAVSGGAVGRLVTAFSREQAEKIYVQDRLREDGPHVAELMVNQGAKVYVCGDGGAMFKGVNATLCEILAEHGGIGSDEAAAYLKTMAQEGRYLRDVWS